MVKSCLLEKGKYVSNKQCYGLSVSPQNFKNTEVFTKTNNFEIEIFVSTRPH